MIEELDTAALTRDVEKYKLVRGDMGTVVHIYPDRGAYEVEFISAGGDTIAVLTLLPGDIRAVGIEKPEILHVRELAPA